MEEDSYNFQDEFNNNSRRGYNAKIKLQKKEFSLNINNLKSGRETIKITIQNLGNSPLPNNFSLEGEGKNLIINSKRLPKPIPIEEKMDLDLNIQIKQRQNPNNKEQIKLYLYDSNKNTIDYCIVNLVISGINNFERIDSARSSYDNMNDFEENLNKLKEFFAQRNENELTDALNQAKGNYEEAIQLLLEN